MLSFVCPECTTARSDALCVKTEPYNIPLSTVPKNHEEEVDEVPVREIYRDPVREIEYLKKNSLCLKYLRLPTGDFSHFVFYPVAGYLLDLS